MAGQKEAAMKDSSKLAENMEHHGGKYVVKASFKTSEIITSGKDPAKVLASAKKKGVRGMWFIFTNADPGLPFYPMQQWHLSARIACVYHQSAYR